MYVFLNVFDWVKFRRHKILLPMSIGRAELCNLSLGWKHEKKKRESKSFFYIQFIGCFFLPMVRATFHFFNRNISQQVNAGQLDIKDFKKNRVMINVIQSNRNTKMHSRKKKNHLKDKLFYVLTNKKLNQIAKY